MCLCINKAKCTRDNLVKIKDTELVCKFTATAIYFWEIFQVIRNTEKESSSGSAFPRKMRIRKAKKFNFTMATGGVDCLMAKVCIKN